MLGGGTFTSQNQKLPGAYINFISGPRASTESERGIAAIPFELDWGLENEIFSVTKEDFEQDSRIIFGYDQSHAKMKNLREVFKRTKTLLCYRLNGDGVKATNTFATARYGGVRGNDLKIVIAANVDTPANFDVKTLLDNIVIDSQTVATAAGLVDNEFVTFKTGATLAATAGLALADGTNGAAITGSTFTAYLTKLESYNFNTLGCPSVEDTVAVIFDNFTKRMRDTLGVKFQLVRPKTTTVPNYEGVIVVPNTVSDAGAAGHELVYWLAGAESACQINASLTNTTYDGEYVINVNYTLSQLEDFVTSGYLVFHRFGTGANIMTDINSLTTFSEDKNSDFASNQTVRVLDQVGNDIAALFNTKYLGKIPNDAAGRASFWSDVITYCKSLEQKGAIQNFKSDTVTVEQGSKKASIVVGANVQPMNCMEQLFATFVVE